jgi:hypothetical protein
MTNPDYVLGHSTFELERLARQERLIGMPPLVKAGLLHVQFESIHPFLDGNGRVGRLLITLFLCTQGILQQPPLPQPLLQDASVRLLPPAARGSRARGLGGLARVLPRWSRPDGVPSVRCRWSHRGAVQGGPGANLCRRSRWDGPARASPPAGKPLCDAENDFRQDRTFASDGQQLPQQSADARHHRRDYRPEAQARLHVPPLSRHPQRRCGTAGATMNVSRSAETFGRLSE